MHVVKLSKKEQLDRLIARITLHTGKKPTQQEVLDAAVEIAEKHYDELEMQITPKPLLDEEKLQKIGAIRERLARIEWCEPKKDLFPNENDAEIYMH